MRPTRHTPGSGIEFKGIHGRRMVLSRLRRQWQIISPRLETLYRDSRNTAKGNTFRVLREERIPKGNPLLGIGGAPMKRPANQGLHWIGRKRLLPSGEPRCYTLFETEIVPS